MQPVTKKAAVHSPRIVDYPEATMPGSAAATQSLNPKNTGGQPRIPVETRIHPHRLVPIQ